MINQCGDCVFGYIFSKSWDSLFSHYSLTIPLLYSYYLLIILSLIVSTRLGQGTKRDSY